MPTYKATGEEKHHLLLLNITTHRTEPVVGLFTMAVVEHLKTLVLSNL